MSELKNGILDVNGFLVSKNTKPEDFEALPPGVVELRTSKRGDVTVKFVRPFISTGFMGDVKVLYTIDEPYPKIAIRTKVVDSITYSEDRAKIALYSSKKWLKAIMDAEPTAEDNMSLLYEFDWGYVMTECWQDREYGLVGGNITIEFEE